MSTYVTFEADSRSGQVKMLGDDLTVYRPGDIVDAPFPEFSIAMREGGFVNITHGIFESWTDQPKHSEVFDKWGSRWSSNEKNAGLLGEAYFFTKPKYPKVPE